MGSSVEHIAGLKSTGLRVTTARVTILEIFETSNRRHLTADDVFRLLLQQSSDIGLATVYRVLTQFEQAGILLRSNFESAKSVYELNHGNHHDHMVCVDCGDVEEFVDEEIERRQHQIAEEKEFFVKDHSLTLYGSCKNCNQKKIKQN
ncbi:MAG: ferric iron uptake transcriptional regulator [Betaproteobacteria bacterium TMED156]|nr:MAG: ferric iron uptake transcriptional regulator [Betaproteobacteria bacterium TMED156]